MKYEFVEVAGAALEEARDKFARYFRDASAHQHAVDFALGLFTGIATRRMRGEPDPDPVEPSEP